MAPFPVETKQKPDLPAIERGFLSPSPVRHRHSEARKYPALTSCLSATAAESGTAGNTGRSTKTILTKFPPPSRYHPGVTFLYLSRDPWRTIIVNKSGFKAGAKENNINIPSLWFVALTARHHQGKGKAHNVSIVDFSSKMDIIWTHERQNPFYFPYRFKYHDAPIDLLIFQRISQNRGTN